MVQKMCASSCWKRRTLVNPVSVPDSSFLWRTPKSASLRGSSRHERGLWPNIKLKDSQREAHQNTATCINTVRGSIHCINHWETIFFSPSAANLPVPGAVHWLQSKDVIFYGEGEHVFTVVLPVARCLPQFAVIDVGGGYFLKASSPVLILEKHQNHIS